MMNSFIVEGLDSAVFRWLKFERASSDFLVLAGIAGGVAALITSIIGYKNKSKDMKTSVYLIHTRMAAQGIIIGTLAGGAIYHLWKDHFGPYLRGESKRL